MPYEQLLQKALGLISRHRYTVLKLKEKLVSYYEKQIEKGELPPVSKTEKDQEIKKVLPRLKELRYLDDTQYSKDFITTRTELKPKGRFMLQRELRKKGIHPDLAKRILEETEIDENANAIKALEKRIPSLSKEPPFKRKQKAMRFLASRGFNLEAIYNAIKYWYNKTEM